MILQAKYDWRSHEKDQLPKLSRTIDSPNQIMFLSEESNRSLEHTPKYPKDTNIEGFSS